MSEKMIDFPVIEAQQHEKLKSIILSLGEHLKSPVTFEEVRMLRVKYDASCLDMDVILKQLAGDPAGIKVKRVRREPFNRKPYRISEPAKDKTIDPMGS